MGRDKLVEAIIALLEQTEDRLLIVIYNLLLKCGG